MVELRYTNLLSKHQGNPEDITDAWLTFDQGVLTGCTFYRRKDGSVKVTRSILCGEESVWLLTEKFSRLAISPEVES